MSLKEKHNNHLLIFYCQDKYPNQHLQKPLVAMKLKQDKKDLGQLRSLYITKHEQ